MTNGIVKYPWSRYYLTTKRRVVYHNSQGVRTRQAEVLQKQQRAKITLAGVKRAIDGVVVKLAKMTDMNFKSNE